MIIGIDASRALRAQRTGTENYSLQLIRSLLALETEHKFRLYVDRPPPPGLFGSGVEDCRVLRSPRLWTHVRLSVEMAVSPPDVLFVPAHVVPLIHSLRSVVTVHDLGYLRHPEAHTWTQRSYLNWSTRWSVGRSVRVIADSEATLSDLDQWLPGSADKSKVVHPGRDELLREVTEADQLLRVHQRYGIRGRYLLHLGTLQPRKNLVRLVEAFSQLADQELYLVLAGKPGWLAEPILQRVADLDLTDRVVFTGYVDEDDLAALHSAAVCFVFPSLYEGFGFPVLEAQACGTPVVASSRSSVPEVAGDGAILVDPEDTGAIAAAIERVLSSESVQSHLVARGFANLNRFSWRRCAEETLAVLEEAGSCR